LIIVKRHMKTSEWVKMELQGWWKAAPSLNMWIILIEVNFGLESQRSSH